MGLNPSDQGDQSNPNGFRGLALRGGPPGRRAGHSGASCGDPGFGGVAVVGCGALVCAPAVGASAAGRIAGAGMGAALGATMEGALGSG